jgi:hypothetical protein
LFGRKIVGEPDSLQGYKLASIDISDPVFLAKGEAKSQLTVVQTNDIADSINGTALAFTNEELLTADQYEPVGYVRVSVKLVSGKPAWLYIANP